MGNNAITSEQEAEIKRDRRSAFAEPLFKRYFPASCVTTLGVWISRFLFGWSAWELTHSAFWVGMVTTCLLLPMIFLSPFFGIISDRINPRNGMLLTIFGQGAIAGMAAMATALGHFSLQLLLVLAICIGLITSAHTPIRLALIPKLVSRQALPSAIGTAAIVFNTSRILGPAAGGWLLAQFSMTLAFSVSMLLFCAGFVLLLGVRGIKVNPYQGNGSMLRDLDEGLAYVRRHRGIKLILGFTLINGLLGRVVIELLPAISGQLLNGDAHTLAVLTATAGAGSIAGGFYLSRQGSDDMRLLEHIIIALVTGALALFFIEWLDSLVGLCILVAYTALTATIVGTGCQALAQLRVDEHYRGRVLSLWSVLAMGTPAVGAFVMGAGADIVGFPMVLAVFSAATLIGAGALHRKKHWLLRR